MANPLYFPIFRAFDDTGAPLAGGKVYTYDAGTNNPRTTYTNSTLMTANSNPVILDAEGYPTSGGIWLDDGFYKIDLYDANNVQQDGYPVDNFQNAAGAQGPAGTFQMSTAAGTVDAITATYSPVVTLSNLVTVGFVATGANTVANPTFAPDGLTARTITKKGGQPLSPGDIPAALAVCILEYNSANTRWELVNPATDEQPWVVATGTADAIVATYAPAIPALYDGLIVNFRAAAANATTTPTFAPNGLTARTIVKSGGSALVAGNIAGNFAEYTMRYNLANTRWELLNPTPILAVTPYNLTTLTASGNWSSPSNTTSATVFKFTLTAPGGGGAGNANAGAAGGGGGGGATCIYFASGLAASTNYVYTQGAVGTGGASGANNGVAGGTSTFVAGVTMTATGGAGGNAASNGGLGGTATNGTINVNGGDGGPGTIGNINIGTGYGGPSFWGGGGASNTGGTANAGVAYGSGGGGGYNNGAHAGGNGAPGILVIERMSG